MLALCLNQIERRQRREHKGDLPSPNASATRGETAVAASAAAEEYRVTPATASQTSAKAISRRPGDPDQTAEKCRDALAAPKSQPDRVEVAEDRAGAAASAACGPNAQARQDHGETSP